MTSGAMTSVESFAFAFILDAVPPRTSDYSFILATYDDVIIAVFLPQVKILIAALPALLPISCRLCRARFFLALMDLLLLWEQ